MTIEIQLSPTPNPDRQTRLFSRSNCSLQLWVMFKGMVTELHGACDQQPRPQQVLRRPAGRADQRDRLRRPPRHHGAARHAGLQLDERRLPRGHARQRDHRGSHRQGGRRAPRPSRDAAVLRLRHGHVLRPLARDAVPDGQPAEDVSRELVPQGQGRTSSCGRASARTCACSSGWWTGRACASAVRRRRSAGCPRPGDLTDIIAEQGAGKETLPRLHPVHVAAQSIDLAIMGDAAIRMSTIPAWKSIGGKTRMHERQRRGHRRIAQVCIVFLDLFGHQHALVGERASRTGWPRRRIFRREWCCHTGFFVR